mmetsp:Transcript_9444/g.18968  ORF Transcript_9444/g.18968 Transcript_9444/m.18968 type:complete len:81 (-) Transcript_9444:207-449(-)
MLGRRQVMHTRVYGQASVLALLMSLMIFRDYMDRNGKFLEAEEQATEEHTALDLQQEAVDEARELIEEARAHLAPQQTTK